MVTDLDHPTPPGDIDRAIRAVRLRLEASTDAAVRDVDTADKLELAGILLQAEAKARRIEDRRRVIDAHPLAA